jgi:Protein of unknown function (DUF3072)
MSEFASETTQAAQEEVQDVQAGPDAGETLGSSTPEANDALVKDPSDWVSGDDPITPSQKSYLDTLARQAGEELPADMTKAEASQHIDRLRTQTGQEG